MLTTVDLYSGISPIDPADWLALSGPRLDSGHAYLGFREQVEPGPAVVATLSDRRGLAAAAHATLTCPRTALFSHPWKMLAAEQFLRLDGLPDGPARAEVRHRHARLLAAITGRAPSADQAPSADRQSGADSAGQLTAALGEALVLRMFDSSEVLVRPDLDPGARARAVTALLGRLQGDVDSGLAGAVVLPFVRPEDHELRAALAGLGFQGGALTAVCSFDLSGYGRYAELLGALRSRTRSRYLHEERSLGAAGLRLAEVRLADQLDRVVELEARNAEKYGGTPDRVALRATRAAMAARLGSAVRVPVAIRDQTLVACGIHLVDAHSYYALVYGCDYSVPERTGAYQCVTYYDPMRYALAHGIGRLRVGFEAFTPKLLRGAVLQPREMWVWVPDPGRAAALGELLRFVAGRSADHFREISARYCPVRAR